VEAREGNKVNQRELIDESGGGETRWGGIGSYRKSQTMLWPIQIPPETGKAADEGWEPTVGRGKIWPDFLVKNAS